MPKGTPIKLSQSTMDEIITDYQNGFSARQIAAKYGMRCQKSVTKILNKQGIRVRNKVEATVLRQIREFSQDDLSLISKLNENVDMTVSAIAKQFDCDPLTVKKLLVKHGIFNRHKRDDYLISKFDTIDTEEQAY